MKLYIIGSLRNAAIPSIANMIRDMVRNSECPDLVVFDDWYSAGPEADDHWKKYEQEKGHSYIEALSGAAARNVFQFDKRNIDESDGVVLVLPAGRSGHLELGYSVGCGKKTFILIDDPERWDVMYQFASEIHFEESDLLEGIYKWITASGERDD